MKVAVLSGFLGAGKTTLLRHLLLEAKKSKVAVIVNDMASMNVDAELVKSGAIAQLDEKPELVEMQNGCICCTLRMDLLRSLANLARSGKFDYCIIESTGISEPMQVAETFMLMTQAADGQEGLKEMFEESEIQELKELVLAERSEDRLAHLAQLDACVTVIDALNFFNTFEDDRVVGEVEPEQFEGDERTLTDLMVDQVEFADIIILNKIDLVSDETRQKIRGVISQLNPSAKLVETRYSAVDPSLILNTGLFDFAKAMTHAGWLQSVQGKMVPETEEYGVSSFVYRRRRAFHPQRLYDLITNSFILQEFEEYDQDDEDEDEDDDKGDGEEGDEKEEEEEEDPKKGMSREEIHAQVKAKKEKSVFRTILRSKGFMWLATRPKEMGEWSQAGLMLTLRGQGTWLCEMPAETLAMLDEELVKKDLGPDNDDHRQELVFIGAPLNREEIEHTLDECLVTDEEMKAIEDLEDPFEEWVTEE